MRILYVGADNPAVETILNGMDDNTLGGLPAFYYPFKKLLESGCTIDLLLYTTKKRTVRESMYFKNENLIQVHPGKTVLPPSLDFILQMTTEVRKLLNSRQYDFVYGMSEGAHLAVREAARRGIPCGLRQFGTQEMANVLEAIPYIPLRRLKALKDYTYITLSMFSKKTFVLATNDGSRADQLYDMLGIKKKIFRFYFWRSGVFIPESRPKVDNEEGKIYPAAYDSMALSMVNRIADVKRQDRAARILGELHKRGYPFHLYLIGTDDSPMMHKATVAAAKEYGVEAYLHFEGGKSQKECRQYARNSFVTLLPCEWNRVNVFYEVMGEGAVVVTNDNHSIDEFIEDGVNCLVYEEDNFVQAAEKIIALTQDPLKIECIRTAAHQTAKEKFMSLEKRFGLEAQLVMDAANGMDLSKYPRII